MCLERNPQRLIWPIVRALRQDAQERVGVVVGEAEFVTGRVEEIESRHVRSLDRITDGEAHPLGEAELKQALGSLEHLLEAAAPSEKRP